MIVELVLNEAIATLLLNRVTHTEDILECIVQHRLIVMINMSFLEFLIMLIVFLNAHCRHVQFEAHSIS
jgi:hypothetical protein